MAKVTTTTPPIFTKCYIFQDENEITEFGHVFFMATEHFEIKDTFLYHISTRYIHLLLAKLTFSVKMKNLKFAMFFLQRLEFYMLFYRTFL